MPVSVYNGWYCLAGVIFFLFCGLFFILIDPFGGVNSCNISNSCIDMGLVFKYE
jgi:hypothetical protein